MIAYAACLEGSDPVRLFDKRVNAKRGITYPVVYIVEIGRRLIYLLGVLIGGY